MQFSYYKHAIKQQQILIELVSKKNVCYSSLVPKVSNFFILENWISQLGLRVIQNKINLHGRLQVQIRN